MNIEHIHRFDLQNLAKRVKCPPPFLFSTSKDIQTYEDEDMELENLTDEELADYVRTNANGVPMVLPMRLRLEKAGEEEWLLPNEPMVSIVGSHTLVRRSVLKSRGRGSVKERWAQDDYTITIEGILKSENGFFPAADVARLKKYCEAGAVLVINPLLEVFGISRMVIENWDFPFTAGTANQNYSITAYSDEPYNLLIER